MDSKYHLETRALMVRVITRCDNTVLPLSGDRELLPAVHVLHRNLDLSRSRRMQLQGKVVRIGLRSSHFNVAVYCIQEQSIKVPVVWSTVCLPHEPLLLRFTSDFTAVVKLYKINLSFHLILVIKAHKPLRKLRYWSSFSLWCHRSTKSHIFFLVDLIYSVFLVGFSHFPVENKPECSNYFSLVNYITMTTDAFIHISGQYLMLDNLTLQY